MARSDGLPSITSRNIIMALRWMFGRFGYPKKIVTDNGSQLCSKAIKLFLDEKKVELETVALYTPNQNGLVERVNRVILEKLKEEERFEWEIPATLTEMLIDYRSTPHATTGISPF